MQEQRTPPSDTQTEKVPLEEQGHLSRTQLYMVAAFLSIAVLGLVGYIAWDYFQTDESTTQSTTSETEEETTESTEADDEELEENEEEETEEETDANIQLSSAQFTVEYWKDDGGVLDLSIDLPEGATISMEGLTATRYTVISYEDMTLTFSIPHFGFNETYSEYTAISSASISNLYRVKQNESRYKYVNDIVLEGTCDDPTETVNAPCGAYVIEFPGQIAVSVSFDGQNESLTLADDIMATLALVE